MAGGAAEARDGQRVKAVAAAGSETRDRGGSGSGGPVRARVGRFRPRSPSYISRRRRSGVGAKLFDLDVDVVGDGEAGVVANQNGVAVGARQDGVAIGARQDGAMTGAGKEGAAESADQKAVAAGAEQEAMDADVGHVAEKTSKY